MNIVIVGGGEIGEYLAQSLSEEGNKVSIVEIDEEKSEELAQKIDALVINGDGTKTDVLKDAGILDADVLVTVTDNDNVNFVASKLGKDEFGVKQTIARVNEGKKEELFEIVDIDSVITIKNAAATTFKNAIKSKPLKTLFSYGDQDIELNEFKVKENSVANKKSIKDIDLPEDSVIVSVIRKDKVIFPKGHLVFEPRDRVQILMYSKDVKRIKKLFR